MQTTIFDPEYSSMAHADTYRAWVLPELYPEEPQARLENWNRSDLESYCGIYAKEAHSK